MTGDEVSQLLEAVRNNFVITHRHCIVFDPDGVLPLSSDELRAIADEVDKQNVEYQAYRERKRQ